MSERASGEVRPAVDHGARRVLGAAGFPGAGRLRRAAVPDGRKRGASVWGISQTLEDFVGTRQRPKDHGPGILRNSSVKVIGQQPGDLSPLVEHLALEKLP